VNSELLDIDPASLSDAELSERLLEFARLRAQLDAAELAVTAEWDARQAWAADGAVTGAAWLRSWAGLADSTARERVRVARKLRSMPLAAEALRGGEVSYGKVRALAEAFSEQTAEAFVRDEIQLVAWARQFSTDQFKRLVSRWRTCADPDGFAAEAAKQWERRSLRLSQSLDSGWMVDGFLDVESGAIIKTVLDAIEDELFRSENTEQSAGGDAAAAGRPTASQRRADALVEMARRAATASPQSGRSRPELMVILDHDTLVARAGGAAELTDGQPLSGEAARRLACDANIIRAVTKGASEVLDLGRSTAVVSAAQRRALTLRDRGCIFPGCDRPPGHCEAHHLIPYARGQDTGGPTDLANLGLLCTRHHHLVHDGGYQIDRNAVTGQVTAARPGGTVISALPLAS